MSNETKRDYRKFFTYPETAAFMARLLNATDGQQIIEPSAGDGRLVKAVNDFSGDGVIIDAVELDDQWEKDLNPICRKVFISDFLRVPLLKNSYDGCIANPPFGNGVDLQSHFDKIHDIVKPLGKIIAIVPFDFFPTAVRNYYFHPLENWSKNSDGTTTAIKLIEFKNPY